MNPLRRYIVDGEIRVKPDTLTIGDVALSLSFWSLTLLGLIFLVRMF